MLIHMSHKSIAFAFAKSSSYLQDVQEWMFSSKLKVNPCKTVFQSQLQKMDSHHRLLLFGNFILPAVTLKNLDVTFVRLVLSKYMQSGLAGQLKG